MGCFAVPAVAAIVHHVLRKRTSWKHSKHHSWLNLLFAGGAVFGIVDHLWNGELFIIGPNIAMDMMLGVVITAAIVGVWGVMVAVDKHAQKEFAQSRT